MVKFWFVALNEYKRHVFQKKFLLAIFSLPALLGVSILSGFLAESSDNSNEPLGYVDHSDVLADPLPIPEEYQESRPVELIAFDQEGDAAQALASGEIQAYYVLPVDYLETRDVQLVFYNDPGRNALDEFRTLLKVNLSAGLDPNAVNRILEGTSYTVRTPDGSRSFSEDSVFSDLVLPLISGFLLMFTLITSAGYLSTAVAEEKENRTIEILATSMSANQFILGKIIGIVMVVATQIGSWIVFIFSAVLIGKASFDFEWLQNARVDPNMVWLLLGLLVPSFFFFAGLTVAISSTATETSEGQQAMGLVSMPLGFSYWFAAIVIADPNGTFATILSMIPFTAPSMMPLRAAFSVVPTWQVAACIAILSVCAIFAVWLAARAYEMGLLRYGKRLRLAEVITGSLNNRKQVIS